MSWATVSSWSCFCWLYRASPSLTAKNIISLMSVLTIWWYPCVESSLGLLEKGVCYAQRVLLTKLLVFALFLCVPQGQTCLFFWVSLDFLLLHSNPQWWKGVDESFWWWKPLFGLVLEDIVSLHRNSQIQLLRHQWLGHRLGLPWCWMVCLGNRLEVILSF